MIQNRITALFKNTLEAYSCFCRPICKKYDIQQTALDILLFLANNPGRDTAMDIHKCRGIKQSMVSFHVERLFQDGYLERMPVPGDRRKVRLVYTPKAQPLIEEGRKVQEKFNRYLFEGITQEDRDVYERMVSTLEQNIQRCMEMTKKGEPKQDD